MKTSILLASLVLASTSALAVDCSLSLVAGSDCQGSFAGNTKTNELLADGKIADLFEGDYELVSQGPTWKFKPNESFTFNAFSQYGHLDGEYILAIGRTGMFSLYHFAALDTDMPITFANSRGFVAAGNNANAEAYYRLFKNVSAVPEPEPLVMLAAGLAVLGFVGRRRMKG